MAKIKLAWNRIVLGFTVLGLAVCLIVYISSANRGDPVCKGIEIKIRNLEEVKLIAPGNLERMIEQSRIAGKGKPLNDDVVKKVLKLVSSKGSVKNVLAYQTGDSILHVELEQRIPVVRILTSAGSCYLDGEGIAFPSVAGYACDTPLVTGKIRLPAEGKRLTDSVFARNLLEFAEFVSNSPFWNAQIQQIDVDENRNVEFAVCSDSHLIRFGQLNGYKRKLDNLLTFYRKVNPYYRERDNSPYRILDLRFNRQIVAIKGNND
ncbi:MAG: hypothetical protein LBQ70_05535 [Prevotellaceae bacterium]|jgi:cell division protein FtsQ|nr:hypothetical protein [Prevotellaceae bacterium]